MTPCGSQLAMRSCSASSARTLGITSVPYSSMLRIYQQHCEALGYERYTDDEMAEFQRVADGIVAQHEPGYADNWGWSKPLCPSAKHRPTFDDLGRLARLDHNKLWIKLSHHAVH